VEAIDWPDGKPRPRQSQREQIAAEVQRLMDGGWSEEKILSLVRTNCIWERIDFPASVVLANLRDAGAVYVPTASEKAEARRLDALAAMREKVSQQRMEIEACTRCDSEGFHYEIIWYEKMPVQGPHWCGHGERTWTNELWALENPEESARRTATAGCTNRAHREAGIDPVTGRCVLCQAQQDIPAQQTPGDSEGARLRAQIRARKG